MELVAHPAMASDARLRRGGAQLELRVVAQATFLLVSGPTEIASAEELDEEAADWLDRAAIPDGAAVVLVGAGAGTSRVTASDEVVTLGPEGRGDRRMPREALRPGSSFSVETESAGTVSTRLPTQGPRAWIDVDGDRRSLVLEPLAVRIDLVGLRLSIVWCASTSIDPRSVGDARLVVHTDAVPSAAAPRSTRPPAPAREVQVIERVEDPPTPAARVDTGANEWDIDSTVSIDGGAPPSLPLPFRAEAVRASPVHAEAPALAPTLAPAPTLEKRSIGQILALGGGGAPPPVPPPAAPVESGPARAGRMRMAGSEGASAQPGEREIAAHAASVPPFAVLHVEPGTSARLRRAPSFRAVLQAPSRAAQRAADQAGEDEAVARDARDAVAAMRGCPAVALGAIAGEVARGVDDGLFVAPLLVLEGELELPLDEHELLRAMAEAIQPLRALDRRVEEALDRARAFVDAPWLDPAVAEAERAALRRVITSLGRGQTGDALDAQVERKLRRDRKHVARTWQGRAWVVASLGPGGTSPGTASTGTASSGTASSGTASSGTASAGTASAGTASSSDGARPAVGPAALALLLPAEAVAVLPVARRLRVRLLVEAHPAHEPDVSEAPSLLAVAIARELVGS